MVMVKLVVAMVVPIMIANHRDDDDDDDDAPLLCVRSAHTQVPLNKKRLLCGWVTRGAKISERANHMFLDMCSDPVVTFLF